MQDVTALVIDDDTHIHGAVEDSLTPHVVQHLITARGRLYEAKRRGRDCLVVASELPRR
jgi:hypothetical protein